jgi:hypothetical protein
MGKHMPPPSFLIVQTNHLTTDRALGVDRIQASSARELEKFDNPYPKIAHDCLVDCPSFEPQQSRPALMGITTVDLKNGALGATEKILQRSGGPNLPDQARGLESACVPNSAREQ